MSLKICLLVTLVGFTAAAKIQGKKAASHEVDENEKQSRVARQLSVGFDADYLGHEGSLYGNSDVEVGYAPQHANIQQFSGGSGVPQGSSNSRSTRLLRRDNGVSDVTGFVPDSVGFGQGGYNLQRSGGLIRTDSGVPQAASSQNEMVPYQSGVPYMIPIQQAAPAASGYYGQSAGPAVLNMIPIQQAAPAQRSYISQSAGQPGPNCMSIQPVAPAFNYIPSERFGQAVVSSGPVQSVGPAGSNSFSGQAGGQGGSSGIYVQPAGPVQAIPLFAQQGGIASESRQPSEQPAPRYISVQVASSGPTNSFSSRISGQADPSFTSIQSAGPAQANSFSSQSSGQSGPRYVLLQPAGAAPTYSFSGQANGQAAPNFISTQLAGPARDNSASNQQSGTAISSQSVRPIYILPSQQGGSVIPSQSIRPINSVPSQQSGSAISSQSVRPIYILPRQQGGLAIPSSQSIRPINSVPSQQSGSAMSSQFVGTVVPWSSYPTYLPSGPVMPQPNINQITDAGFGSVQAPNFLGFPVGTASSDSGLGVSKSKGGSTSSLSSHISNLKPMLLMKLSNILGVISRRQSSS